MSSTPWWWRSLVLLVASGRSLAALVSISTKGEAQRPLLQNDRNDRGASIPLPLFASLERFSRIVDIAYCVGNTGISKPFSCISRCSDFPSLELVTSWNTGLLLSDSCGYIAVDHKKEAARDGNVVGRAGLRTAIRRDADASDADVSFGPSIIVAFRGTYSITNTIVDLSTVPQEYVPYPSPDDDPSDPPDPSHRCTNCTVHLGFLLSWRNARELVLPELVALRQQYPGYPIELVGHSLGGAVAALAALELKASLGWDDITVTTFGEPRAGNEGFNRFIDRVFDLDNQRDVVLPEKWSYRRVTHQNDPVPLLPLGEWGYSSHAGELYISKPDLPPSPSDIQVCRGDRDKDCIAGADGDIMDIIRPPTAEKMPATDVVVPTLNLDGTGIPGYLKLWQLFFAHRDYFWRLGLCVPGGDPANWRRKGDAMMWEGDYRSLKEEKQLNY